MAAKKKGVVWVGPFRALLLCAVTVASSTDWLASESGEHGSDCRVADRGQAGTLCGTAGQRVVGDAVAAVGESVRPTGLRECVRACRARPNCSAVNHRAVTGDCSLVHAADTPESRHGMENAEGYLGVYLKSRCSVTTEPSKPMNFTFVLAEQSEPFRVRFSVRVENSAIIGLASRRHADDIFAHITLGGWSDSKGTIRTGDIRVAGEPGVVIHDEFFVADHLSADEYRSFWIGYSGHLLQVGNCSHAGTLPGFGSCNPVAFLSWEVQTGRLLGPNVSIAISTWQHLSGDWEFDQPCH